MTKKIFLTLFVFLALLFSAQIVHASDDKNFSTDAKVEYKFHESGQATVTNTITIKNLTSEIQAESFIFNLKSIDPQNLQAYEFGNPLELIRTKEKNLTKIKIDFAEAVVGIGESRTFVVTYETAEFSVKNGSIWEVTIPKLSDTNVFDDYKVILSVPESFGQLAYIFPPPRDSKSSSDRNIYQFNKGLTEDLEITANFGHFQVFSFDLLYHLENPLNHTSEIEIAIPPDTSTQKIHYKEIIPRPINTFSDEDGNWLAKYALEAREKVEVKIKGTAQIFASPKKYLTPSSSTLLNNLSPNNFWQSDDPKIKDLALRLKTPEKIYQYVSENLSYNLGRVKPDVQRLGAKYALEHPDQAICLEFTDLFIALSRAAGIPAREINGYAYTESSDLKPLSLVADVLHSWPEYWNEEKGIWVPVDPTWGSTSKINYFDKLDLRHFAFVIHGANPETPYSPGSYKLGSDPQQNVYVNFDTFDALTSSNNALEISFSNQKWLSLFGKKIKIEISNNGSSAVYNLSPEIKYGSNVIKTHHLPILSPYGKFETEIEIYYGILGRKMPEKIIVSAGNEKIEIPTTKTEVIIFQLIFVSSLLIIIIISASFLTSKVKLKNIIKTYVRKIKKEKYSKKTAY